MASVKSLHQQKHNIDEWKHCLQWSGLVHACFTNDGIACIKKSENSKPLKVFHMKNLHELFPDFNLTLIRTFSIMHLKMQKLLLVINPLSGNFTKWSDTLKQFVSKLPMNCFSVFDHFVGLVLKGLKFIFGLSWLFIKKNEKKWPSVELQHQMNLLILRGLYFYNTWIWFHSSVIIPLNLTYGFSAYIFKTFFVLLYKHAYILVKHAVIEFSYFYV